MILDRFDLYFDFFEGKCGSIVCKYFDGWSLFTCGDDLLVDNWIFRLSVKNHSFFICTVKQKNKELFLNSNGRQQLRRSESHG